MTRVEPHELVRVYGRAHQILTAQDYISGAYRSRRESCLKSQIQAVTSLFTLTARCEGGDATE